MSNSVCHESNYQRIYADHAENVRNFLYYKCGDLERAEDLMHEAFIRLWNNCKKVILEKAKGFLFTTANRLFLNAVEHEKVVLSFAKSSSKNVETKTPEYILEEKQFKEKLEKAISELPEGQREVFLLNRIDKLAFEEIAKLQGVSVSAVHKKLYKALDRLRKRVDELGQRKI